MIGKETSPLLHLFRPKIITYFEDIARAGQFLATAAISAVEDPGAGPQQFFETPTLDGFRSGEDILTAKTKNLINGNNNERRRPVPGAIRGE